ncbi:MAG: hypothetical protein M3Q45_07200 [Chloroflexota bacterium]|nr:hypothetical protein [Chloroflexota bacterium]
MTITIKPIDTVEACEQFQELERCVWSSEDVDLMPVHVLITVAHNGGVLLGAYAEDGPAELSGLVGAALGWLGAGVDQADTRPQLKLCSHMAGVLPEWQGKGVGLRLKLAQRDAMLTQGLTNWMTWTYDPLYRANGVFNIHRLGATCHTYFRNRYGTMTDALNAGAPSDRCQVDWWVQSEAVVNILNSAGMAERVTKGAWHVLPTAPMGDFRQPIEQTLPLDGTPLAVPIPDDIAAIRRVDSELGLAWRFYLRDVLESAFSGGYSMVDCVDLPEQGWHYILTEQSQPSAKA